MQKIRHWLNYWHGAGIRVIAGLLVLAVVTAGQAATEPKGKGVEKPVQGQQLCPATPGAGTCQVKVECPPLKAPGKTVCQTTIDCPGAKKPVTPKKTPKTE